MDELQNGSVETSLLQGKLNDLIRMLQNGCFPLPAGKTEMYQKALESVAPLAELDSHSDEEAQRRLDALVMELFVPFTSALYRGAQEPAESCLKAILDSIYYTRKIVPEQNEERQKLQFERKERSLERLVLVAQLQDHLDELGKVVSELEANQSRLNRERDQVGEELRKLQEEDPILRDELEIFRRQGRILGDGIMHVVSLMNRFVKADNLSRKNALVLEKQRMSCVRLDDILQRVNLMAFGSPRLLGNVMLDDLEKTMRHFQEDIAREEQEAERLKGTIERSDELLRSMGEKARKESERTSREAEDRLREFLQMQQRQGQQNRETAREETVPRPPIWQTVEE